MYMICITIPQSIQLLAVISSVWLELKRSSALVVALLLLRLPLGGPQACRIFILMVNIRPHLFSETAASPASVVILTANVDFAIYQGCGRF